MKTAHRQAILALITANIIWGAASPIFKLALQNLPPFTLAFLRFFGASLLLFPLTMNNLKIEKKDLFNLFLLSFFGISINITFFFLGLELAPSINAPIIASSGPVFLYFFSILILHEKPQPKVFFGMLISLAGILLIVGQPIITQGIDRQLIGNLFFILAMFGAVGHAIFSKKIIPKYAASTVTFWSFVIGAFSFLPLFLHELSVANPFVTLDIRGLFGLYFGIFFSSALAYLLFEWGIKRINAQETGLFTYIDPIAAILLAIPLLGEKITLIFLLGSILVFAGIFLAENRLHYHPLHKLVK